MNTPTPAHDGHNGHSTDAGQRSELERVRWHLRSAYASLVGDDVQSALLAVSDADRLLVELIDQDDPEAGRLRAA